MNAKRPLPRLRTRVSFLLVRSYADERRLLVEEISCHAEQILLDVEDTHVMQNKSNLMQMKSHTMQNKPCFLQKKSTHL